VADVPDKVIRELYAAPPDRFMAAREKAASGAADPAVAKAIKALRKPTVAAWTVNLLAIRRPELIESLVELAASLRSAQRELRGEQLRKLAGERRKVISSLVAQAQSLASKEQPGVKVAVAEVEATLAAAMADEQVAEQVRSGRLVRTTTAAGDFTISPTATPSKVEKPAKPRGVPAALKKELTSAEKAEEDAREELSAAETASQKAAAGLERIEEELEELRQRRSEAEEELSHRRQAHRFAQRALAAASRRVMEAQAAIEDATG
jgi:DNA repair exonuclease SbcCD ATPase subunit